MFGWDSFGSPQEAAEETPSPITMEVEGRFALGGAPLGKRAGAESEDHVAFLAWITHVRKKMTGHPVNRPDRMYTWCVRKDHVLWGSVEDFIDIFSASLVKNGDIFFCASDGFKQQEL